MTFPSPALAVLVCGGRDYTDRQRVTDVLDELLDRHGSLYIIEGGAPGADTLAREWREHNGQPGITVAANWTLGKRAGHLRNREMLSLGPDLVLAFPGQRGTADMKAKAKAKAVPVLEVDSSQLELDTF